MDKKLTAEEIEKILNDFDRYMENSIRRHPNWRVGCIICVHPARREINRGILEKKLPDVELAKMVDVYVSTVRNHRLTCLPNRGGAPLTAVENLELHRKRRFPTQGKPWTTKKWILDELLFLREAEMAKPKIDHKQILKLTKEIDAASDALLEARAKGRESRKAEKADGHDEHFSAEQRIEMAKVNGGIR